MHYAVIDLEMCNVPKTVKRSVFSHPTEIIQIGAVLLDDSFAETDTFMSFVAPQFGALDPFIENLTGITAADLENAPSTEEAMQAFLDWLPEDTCIVSWSENDAIQLSRELECKGLLNEQWDAYFDEWIDCQADFGELMQANKDYRLSEALIIADIESVEGEHDALIDARNTALLFAKMQLEPNFERSSHFSSGTNQPQSNPFSILANLNL